MTSLENNRPDGGFEYVVGGTYPATDAERVDASGWCPCYEAAQAEGRA
jgi:hypothetical protein